VLAERGRDDGYLLTVRIRFPDDVDPFDIQTNAMTTLTAQGRSGHKIHVGNDSVTFRDSTLAPEEVLPLIDRAVTEARRQAAELDAAGLERADRREQFAAELQALLVANGADAPP
jgi:hypothetical protein